jgi:hypothetical protein
MADTGSSSTVRDSQLRERPTARPLHLENSDDARQKVIDLNEDEDKTHIDDGEKRTYGRTPDGTGTYIYWRSSVIIPLYEHTSPCEQLISNILIPPRI